MKAVLLRSQLRLRREAHATIAGVRFLVQRNHYQVRKTARDGFEEVFARLLAMADEDTVFLDIGANVGMASLLLARRTGCKAFAFEPVRGTFLDLCANLARNPSLDVTPLNLGVSDTSGMLRITSARASGINHVVADKEVAEEAQDAIFIRLDDLCALPLPPKAKLLLKLDVERHEINVLRGGRSFLSAERPMAVCCEFYSADNLEEMADLLGQCGFHRIDPPLADLPGDGVADHSNAFFVNRLWPET